MRCILVNTEADFIKMESVLGTARMISLDTETNCLDVFWNNFELVGISLAADTQTGFYIPLGHRVPPKKEDAVPPQQLPVQWVMSRLGRFLKGRRVCGANHKFDSHVFDRYRTNMGVTTFDALLAAYVWDSRDCKMSLKDITFTKLGYKAQEITDLCKEVRPKGKKSKNEKRNSLGFEFLDPKVALPYAAADAVNVLRLHRWYTPRLQADNGLNTIMGLEIELAPIVKRMEQCGMLLDTAKLREMHDSLLEKEGEFAKVLQTVSGNTEINPKSLKQLGELLYHRMRLPTPDGKKLYPRDEAPPEGWLDGTAIEGMLQKVKDANQDYFGDPRVQQWAKQTVINLLSIKLKVAKLAKLRTTYTLNLVNLINDDGRIHPDFKQIMETGRMSSGGGWNAMNLPRGDDKDTKGYDIRSAFISDPGYVFVKADYSAQELRVLAALSNDPTLTEILLGSKKDEEGDEIDLHIYVASMSFNAAYLDIKHAVQKKKKGETLTDQEKTLVQHRQDAKPVSFGICLRAGTQILTETGYKNIEDVRVGEMVLTHKKRFRMVTAVQQTTTQDIVQIRTNSGKIVESTPDHMYLCYFPTNRCGFYGWVRAADMTTQNYLVYQGTGYESGRSVEEAYCKLIGWYISEGCISSSYIKISQSPEASPEVSEQMSLYLSPLGFVWGDVGKSSPCMRTHKRNWSDLLGRFGIDPTKKAAQKSIPECAFGFDGVSRRNVLGALWDGDGCVSVCQRRCNISYCTISKQLAKDVQKMLDSVGINSTIYHRKDRDMYDVHVSNSMGRVKFLEEIPTVKAKGHKYLAKKVFFNDEHVSSVTTTHIAVPESVYDLTTEEDHSFAANGLFTHNCYGITEIGLAEQLDKPREFAAFLIQAWKTKAFPVAAAWLDAVPQYARHNLYVMSYLGRKRRMSPAALQIPMWQFNSRIANQMKNDPIQSSSADMAKMAMIRIDRALQKEFGDDVVRMCCMVHDEIVTLCKEEYAEQVSKVLVREMADEINGIPFPVEVTVSNTLSKE